MNKIYILEGPDGTGKSTLASEIVEQIKGHVSHCSYDKSWNIEEYHRSIIEVARKLAQYQPVVIDRWAPSEFVYGTVFRNNVSYNTSNLIERFFDDNIVWIYCRNDDAVKNHKKNIKTRNEMFGL